MPEDWQARIDELVSDNDERAVVLREKQQTEEKLRRLKRMYRDLLVNDEEYQQTLRALNATLSSLVNPSSQHLVGVGEFLQTLEKV
jgi:hypothetical protein